MPATVPSDAQIDRLSSDLVKSNIVQLGLQANPRICQVQAHQSIQEVEPPAALHSMFSSLSITDPRTAGSPISMHSKDFVLGPSGLRVGACQFLNPPYGGGEGCGLSTQMGEDGRPRFALHIGGRLIGVQSGTTEFGLASQIDITEVVRNLAVARWKQSQEPLPADDLEIEWLDIVNDIQSHSPPLCEKPQRRLSSRHTQNVILSDANLCGFFRMIQEVTTLHQNYFVLTPNRFVSVYDVAWVSPSLLGPQKGRYTKNPLRKAPPEVLYELAQAMSLGDSFSITLSLGPTAAVRRIFCVPLFQPPKLKCWVCFLVGSNSADLHAN